MPHKKGPVFKTSIKHHLIKSAIIAGKIVSTTFDSKHFVYRIGIAFVHKWFLLYDNTQSVLIKKCKIYVAASDAYPFKSSKTNTRPWEGPMAPLETYNTEKKQKESSSVSRLQELCHSLSEISQ